MNTRMVTKYYDSYVQFIGNNAPWQNQVERRDRVTMLPETKLDKSIEILENWQEGTAQQANGITICQNTNPTVQLNILEALTELFRVLSNVEHVKSTDHFMGCNTETVNKKI